MQLHTSIADVLSKQVIIESDIVVSAAQLPIDTV